MSWVIIRHLGGPDPTKSGGWGAEVSGLRRTGCRGNEEKSRAGLGRPLGWIAANL